MKNSFLLFLFTFTTQITFAQNVKLQINDKQTKEAVEFATILLPDYKKSLISNEKGLFILDAQKYKFPLKVVIDHFGFDKKEIILPNSNSLKIIFIEPSSELLQEIIIPPANAKIKERTYGRTSEGSGIMSGEDSSSSYNTSYEFGMIINIKEKFLKVKKIHWHLEGFTFKRGFFSVYFYEVKNGKPYKRIPHQNINFILSHKTRGWNTINIEDRDFYLSSYKKIAVIIKQQKVEFNDGKKEGSFFQNIGLTSGSTFFTRTSPDDEWLAIPASIPLYITVDSYE
ncbi:hypothetical protein [Paenimyroides viscosum]|uniref:Carboxypeptidase-like regulatory domain-containing protein n=1 Tax=Paenimyroides viscosum TaxID=2488729 RepID=A0A3P1B2K3_9FLAO|nr:hypothetical protein [Paenimyroides viscosum]RRA95390.1 hypothetical protein EG242_05910 [Paenimyroides viscosum]